MTHFKIVCAKCGTIINQCRCMSKEKAIEYGICSTCNSSLVEAELQTWMKDVLKKEDKTDD
jgi:hypothetical protein